MAFIEDTEHSCDNPDVDYDKGFSYGTMGETVEKLGFCNYCKKKVREIWIYSTEIINE
tara:strand:- start:462 stop:635 length:174 start_codon:yes stop_codon:yes gene_type:complete